MLRTTVIAKTDLSQSTQRMLGLTEQELSRLLRQQKQMVTALVTQHTGEIVKGEGDAFWITFPSVTAAAQFALAMQRELRASQIGKSESARLAAYVGIAVGDVLHQDNDIFGDAVNLTARIQALAPPDGIYLSHAAWLMLKAAEIQTTYVGEFMLKGFPSPERVYQIENRLGMKVLTEQVIVHVDLSGFNAYTANHTPPDIERLLLEFQDLIEQVCADQHGVERGYTGDSTFITFTEGGLALQAVEAMVARWRTFAEQHHVDCWFRITLHRGDVYLFGTFLFGDELNETMRAEMLGRRALPRKDQHVILLTAAAQHAVADTPWAHKLQLVATETDGELYRLNV